MVDTNEKLTCLVDTLTKLITRQLKFSDNSKITELLSYSIINYYNCKVYVRGTADDDCCVSCVIDLVN